MDGFIPYDKDNPPGKIGLVDIIRGGGRHDYRVNSQLLPRISGVKYYRKSPLIPEIKFNTQIYSYDGVGVKHEMPPEIDVQGLERELIPLLGE